MDHKLKLRVYYEDTDAGGIVYHANYIKYCERGRSEYLRDLGTSNTEIKNKDGIVFVVRHMDIDYLAMGHLDDLLTVETKTLESKKTSFIMQQNIYRDSVKLFTMRVTLVCVDTNGKPVRIPHDLENKMRQQ